MQSKAICRRRAIVSILATVAGYVVMATGCGGGGGGGGGNPGGSSVTVTGKVLSATSNTAPKSGAKVTIGGNSIATNADGSFSFTVSSNATSATISATGEVTRTITIALKANQVNDLGNIFLADDGGTYTATVTGRVVTKVKGVTQPVGGASVTIGNVTAITTVDGKFTLNGLPVDIGSVNGIYGKVTAAGFAEKLISADTLQFALIAGANPIGDLLIAAPSGSTPLPPYTITGLVNVVGSPGVGVAVDIALQGSGVGLGQIQTDATGHYYFWVAPGTYTITAADSGGSIKSVDITLPSLTAPVMATTINLSP